MNASTRPIRFRQLRSLAAPLLRSFRCLSLVALTALGSACSGQYPLGATSSSLDLVGDEPSSGATARADDATLSPVLGAPDFTIAGADGLGPGSLVALGDLDGDGFADSAQAQWDFATGGSFVHVRYGGPRPRDAGEALAFDHGGGFLTYSGNAWGIAPAGDVDADGYDDVLIETDACTYTESAAGVFLVYGGAERWTGSRLLTDAGAYFAAPPRPAPEAGVACGGVSATSGVGDLDGDGVDDFVISFSPQALDSGGITYGTGEGAYVYYGRSERYAGELPPGAADAIIWIDGQAPNASSIGDVTGDGLADLFIANDNQFNSGEKPAFVLPGNAERWSGNRAAADVGVPLLGVTVLWPEQIAGPTDLDGDGIDDLLLRDETERVQHVFYGGPDLLSDGFDFSRADAVQGVLTFIYAGGDLDGDGDTDLVARSVQGDPVEGRQAVALQSGSRTRLSGTFTFPESEIAAAPPMFPDAPARVLTNVIAAGDLDGDGADDLFSTSELRIVEGGDSFRSSTPQIHVHYGKKASLDDSPR